MKLFYTLFLTISISMFFFSCSKKETNNDIVAEKLKGKWEATSLKIDNTETFNPLVSKITTTFFDIEDNKGRYNLKIFFLDSLISEKEGNTEIISEGTKLTLDEDGNVLPTTVNIIELTDNLLMTKGIDQNGKEIIYSGSK